ncbi:hypothetical protein HPP92_002822 [Vanilla planifolia]|uniref:Uncharacterized protein n=1 Tax=Vanilla planifolia TaxID=51239 RepID=A0A835VIU8_VANPL|nr:hypothetical protein HPP92_002822 [Vanilla planifolia]
MLVRGVEDGRAPCCDKANVKRGPWSLEEDTALKRYIEENGSGGNWIALPKKAGIRRCGKSCRLRWLNYLRPNIKHGCFTEEEDDLICSLYKKIGSRWSAIASKLPGRTDNHVKNHWNTKLKKRVMEEQASLFNTSYKPLPPPLEISQPRLQTVRSSTSINCQPISTPSWPELLSSDEGLNASMWNEADFGFLSGFDFESITDLLNSPRFEAVITSMWIDA